MSDTLNQNSGGTSSSSGGSSGVSSVGANSGSGGGGITFVAPSPNTGSSVNNGGTSSNGSSGVGSGGGAVSPTQATQKLIEQMQVPLNYLKAVDTSLLAIFLGAVAILMLLVAWKKLKRGANEASPPRYIKHKGYYYYRSLSTTHRKR